MSYKKLLEALNGIDKTLNHLIEVSEIADQDNADIPSKPVYQHTSKLARGTRNHTTGIFSFAQGIKEEKYHIDTKVQPVGE